MSRSDNRLSASAKELGCVKSHAADMTIRQHLTRFLTPLLAPGSSTAAPLDAAAQARLKAAPAEGGDLIFTGSVIPEGMREPTFRYERRSRRSGSQCISTHVTFALDSTEPLLTQRAVHSPTFELSYFEEIHGQTGAVSSVDVQPDGTLSFTLVRGDATQRRQEGLGAPVIVAPTLFGFILEHWNDLLRGTTIDVRFAASEYARTYDFVLKLVQTDQRTTTVALEPADFFMRLALEPLTVVFDTATLSVVRYVGRVPPRLPNLQMFDARVDYDFAVAEYR